MSDNMSSKHILLLGAGPMAVAYAKVLKSLDASFSVVGRSQKGIEQFHKQTEIKAIPNGVSGWKKRGNSRADYGIIAVSFECLANTAIELMDAGIRKVLLEKPAGLTAQEIKGICEKANETGTQIFVGYNRRFYSSVLKAKEMIIVDGGVKSFNFEFTEWSQHVTDGVKNTTVLKNWFLANSSHVIDLAFFLGGKPREFQSYTAGGNDWHPTASIFAGAGTTHKDALFSYQANWEAPGRWEVEILTPHSRFILRPLEKLQVQKINSTKIESIDIDDRLDLEFKPGIYRQTKAFLKKEINPALLDIHDHYENVTKYYNKMVRSIK